MDMNKFPSAGYGSEEEKDELRKIVERRGLVGVANNSKWNELITFMDYLEEVTPQNKYRHKWKWKPPFRYKWISGYISDWGREWYETLPRPFVGVEWFDIWTIETQGRGALLSLRVIDHSSWIIKELESIGLDYEKIGNIIRVWGYYPKSYEALDSSYPTWS